MEKNNYFYKLLSNPLIYSLSQKIMSATSFREKIIKGLIKRKNSFILDIGCGPAEILHNLKKVHYYGFDVNKHYINFAKKNTKVEEYLDVLSLAQKK